MNKKETICAVIVTYNRKELLLECLGSLKRQTKPLNAIYIIDNASNDGTPELLLNEGYIKEIPWDLDENLEKSSTVKNLTNGNVINLHYVRIHENTGGAGGFYEGVKRAYEKDYQWLWLMDDDAEPQNDALEKLSAYFDEDNVSALANLKIDANGKILWHHRGYFNFKNVFNQIIVPIDNAKLDFSEPLEIDHASFVGILVNKNAIDKVGFPKKEFFIHHDDVEYCIRLRQVGRILLIKQSIIVHKEQMEKNYLKKKLLGKTYKRSPFDKLWIYYYGIRNFIWLKKRCSKNKLSFYAYVFISYIEYVMGIILMDDNKFKRIIFITNAYNDGLNGTFDNNKPKMVLYS